MSRSTTRAKVMALKELYTMPTNLMMLKFRTISTSSLTRVVVVRSCRV